MGKLLDNWFGKDAKHGPGRVREAYVSEFTAFISHFLDERPEVVDDQKTGRLIYWDRKVDPATLAAVDADTVPDDGYGFYYRAWGRNAGAPSQQPSGGRGAEGGLPAR